MKTVFESLVALYRSCEPPLGDDARLEVINSDVISLAMSVLARDPDETGVTVTEGDPQTLAVGGTLRLHFNRPRKRLGLVVDDLDELIRTARLEEPATYFIRKNDHLKGDTQAVDGLTAYHSVVQLIKLLSDSSAYLDKTEEELIFIREGRYSLPVIYGESDLSQGLSDSIANLSAIFLSDLHRPQKLEILASAVYEVTNAARPGERFSVLLKNISELTKKVEEGYRLFAASFSYEKIKSKIQDANIEFTNKIHKAFADIQSQMLGIPVATVIVATQMKYSNGLGSQFWINTGILLGSLIFVVLTIVLILNQQHTLDVLEEEIGRREKTVAEKYEQLRDLLEEAFSSLRDRLRWQRMLLRIVCFIVAAGFIATLVIYFYLIYLPPPSEVRSPRFPPVLMCSPKISRTTSRSRREIA